MDSKGGLSVIYCYYVCVFIIIYICKCHQVVAILSFH